MTTITFNTLKFSQRLEKAGIPREHAIAEAEALSEVFETGTDELATKNDLNILRSEMREMRLDINAQISLLRWMNSLTLALSTATIALLVKLFFTLPH